jgi:hypothetical protein
LRVTSERKKTDKQGLALGLTRKQKVVLVVIEAMRVMAQNQQV